jgi:hypothetical protein
MNYAVVDGFISGNAIAYELTRRGHSCIHVYSSMAMFRRRFRDNAAVFYNDNLIWDHERPSKVLDELDSHNVVATVAGSDSGVDVADSINTALNSRFKNPILDFDRNNRLLMTSLLDEPAEPSSQIENMLRTWKKIIIKPRLSSGGCDRVSTYSQGESKAVDLGGMFLMPYYEGHEFAVDMVSCDGQHRICGVWKYERFPGDDVWRKRVELVNPKEHVQLVSKLYSYVSNALNESQYANGASHTEVMITESGPRLIEVNFRNNGHMDLGTIKTFIVPKCQVDFLADALTDPDHFQSSPTYEARGCILRVYFLNHKERPYSEIDWKRIKAHPGVTQVYEHYRPFDTVPVSLYNYRSVAAIIIMAGADKELLLKQEDELRGVLDSY